jgi:hypothetical protein
MSWIWRGQPGLVIYFKSKSSNFVSKRCIFLEQVQYLCPSIEMLYIIYTSEMSLIF